jgi:hypothetical protein
VTVRPAARHAEPVHQPMPCYHSLVVLSAEVHCCLEAPHPRTAHPESVHVRPQQASRDNAHEHGSFVWPKLVEIHPRDSSHQVLDGGHISQMPATQKNSVHNHPNEPQMTSP